MYESGENYLETIFILGKRNGSIRSIDIARELNFSKPSVSRAVGLLSDSKLISIDGNGFIALTQEGQKKAENIYERHQLLTSFFEKIAGVPKEIAEEDACRVEHVISQKTMDGIKKYLQCLEC